MRLNLLGLGGEFVHSAREHDDATGLRCLRGRVSLSTFGRSGAGTRKQIVGLVLRHARRRYKHDARVRVGDRGEFKELVHRAAPLLILALKLDRNAGSSREHLARKKHAFLRELLGARGQHAKALRRKVLGLLVERHLGAIGLGVHRELDVMSSSGCVGLGVDHHRSPGCDQTVHSRRRDTDALLPARHLQTMKLRPVEQAPEDVLHLLANDSWPVIDHGHAVARALHRRLAPGIKVFDDHREVGQDSAFLASIEPVVDRLLHRGQKRFARIVKAKQVSVLDEKLADRNLLLAQCHLLGGGTTLLLRPRIRLRLPFLQDILHSGISGRSIAQLHSAA